MHVLRSIACFLALPLVASPAAGFTRIVLLGTGGGPGFYATRAQPAQALYVDGVVYLVDCGGGVGDQFRRTSLPLRFLRHVFVTHYHSDHVADLIAFPVRHWTFLEEPITFHGPKPLRKTVDGALRLFRADIRARVADSGFERFDRFVKVEEFRQGGVVHRDEHVTVTAARVDHVPVLETYAYRFDTPDLSVVFSGDTAPSQALVDLARGADLLVHEVLTMDPDDLAKLSGLPLDDPELQHVIDSHTSFRDVGRIAADAGVGTLVLSHFVPADGPLDQTAVRSEIQKSFAGEVVFGEDLMLLP
jgi:ribonuclease BN (tRNA processing enzyme)